MPNFELPIHDISIPARLAKYLDEISSDYPIVAIDERGAVVMAGYAHTDVTVTIDQKSLGVQAIARTANRFVAHSLPDALSFLVEVEAIRQQRTAPYLQFSQGLARAELLGEGR